MYTGDTQLESSKLPVFTKIKSGVISAFVNGDGLQTLQNSRVTSWSQQDKQTKLARVLSLSAGSGYSACLYGPNQTRRARIHQWDHSRARFSEDRFQHPGLGRLHT